MLRILYVITMTWPQLTSQIQLGLRLEQVFLTPDESVIVNLLHAFSMLQLPFLVC
jgi:hypothetical protein